jgi:hypothetical protein
LQCPGVPSDEYQEACETLCIDRYENNPKCEAELLALDDCLETDVTYSCGDNYFVITPEEACGVENYSCYECTGSINECFM